MNGAAAGFPSFRPRPRATDVVSRSISVAPQYAMPAGNQAFSGNVSRARAIVTLSRPRTGAALWKVRTGSRAPITLNIGEQGSDRPSQGYDSRNFPVCPPIDRPMEADDSPCGPTCGQLRT